MEKNELVKFAVVVVAYNRPYETKRLVDSICNAAYDGDVVDLIIDIDKGPKQAEIETVVSEINWSFGQLRIITRPTKMGLRQHIFECGNYTDFYDAIIVLEDDLVVSPEFYRFSKAAAKKYSEEERIAEISLYSYSVNEFEARPFCPEKSKWDVFAMQVVQSWGQCWTRRMWDSFKRTKYYTANNLSSNPELHKRVNSWKDNSWKKYFFNYIVENNLFVIYPYDSYTTNYSEAGEHCKRIVSDYQVCIQSGHSEDYKLPMFEECIKYDSFFERIIEKESLQFSDMCIDLYGSKKQFEGKRYLATINRLPFHVVQEYGLVRKPCETNVLLREPGQGIFIYDLSIASKKPKNRNDNILLSYDYGYLSWKRSLVHGINGLKQAIREHLFKRKAK